MARDPHVTYHRSRLYGKTVYFLTWSAIEYIFVAPGPEEGVWKVTAVSDGGSDSRAQGAPESLAADGFALKPGDKVYIRTWPAVPDETKGA